MDSTQTGRKRKSSCVSNPPDDRPVSHRTRHSVALSSDQALAVSTPQKRRKKVRFSDPGPRLHDTEFGSTSLTPAMRRASFADVVSARRGGDCTPSRRGRRTSSAPTPRFQRSYDPIAPFDESSSERRMQFTPLRQILDMRTQRRIRRIGLSDEITHIEREKRETASFEKTLRTLIQERDALRLEMDALKQSRPDGHFSSSESTMLLESEIETGLDPSVNGDGDSFIINDSAIVSNSPDFRGIRNGLPPATDSLMLFETQPSNVDASTQASQSVYHTETSDLHALTLDLEAARNEKKELFNACRSRVSGLDDPTIDEMFRQSSPPPDFFYQILNVLTEALSRASDAAQALEGISQEISDLGFTGTDDDDGISDMRNHFRFARLELERAIPGETAGVGLEDGKGTLDALVRRVESLAKELGIERDHHSGSLGREKALRGQFNALLTRYETAAIKVNNLEESIASSAGDMLHTRMRMQDLERQGYEQAVGIDRLNAALDKYRDDVKSLEALVSSLEQENMTAREDYAQQISDLESRVADEQKLRSAVEISASKSESRIRELEETVEQNRIRACDLTAQMESLEKEHQKALEDLEAKASDQVERQEEDIGTLNVRISDLSTSLEDTRSEAQRLRQVNAGLEEQLRLEIKARDDMLHKWATDQARSFAFMKETVNSERRHSKVRAANWELRSDDLMSDGTTVNGSEPITPVSMTRFVDVEAGRGKNRRRVDSGIGILTEEDLLEDEDISNLRRGLDFDDIDLPTSDLV
ncbi:hypothetical protein N7510_011558 [Penicillium lagena]|uniref:uncharacterized protein n=1 Tax=Penicillium lagena TaxID=94218 RepID=UPI00253F823A|nr:uncharacterized protein N7510_011558 [Penicillium lagena]KAJ5602024.1 hypothetical protein N7510_011558 [Penicillium lagena]